jgi:hypothetical protein
VGQPYALDVFYAERHTAAAVLQLQTTLAVPQPPTPMLQGAVVFGNDKPGVLASRVSEQPWSVVLLDAQSITGTWTVSMATAAMPALAKIELEFGSPELVLNGFVWMAPEAPTAEDALPRLEDWRGGLVSLALATVDPSDAFPSPVQFTVDSLTFAFKPGTATVFPSATLGAWQARYEADRETLRVMVDKRLLPDTLFAQTRPLVWRRHGVLPMVQALPLTQSQSPPSHPSSSRQLAPFQLPVAADSAAGGLMLPAGWVFGVLEGQQAASSWPRLLGAATPAEEWAVDLPLVSLSLPGLILDPRIAAATTGLPADASLHLAVQLRYDLPYTDEPNALAQVPKIPRRLDEVAPSPADRPPPPPRPLTRGDFGEHWARLSEQASLAAADAVTAFAADAIGQPEVRGLVEPLAWPVDAQLDTASFPGKLTLANAAGLPAAGSMELSEKTALRGISGTFQEEPGHRLRLTTDTAGFDVTAGSAADAATSTGEYRDQRGLLRGASVVGTETVRTRVHLVEVAEGVDLTSALAPFPLQAGAGITWHLWFRDLPCASGRFQRAATLSSQNEDINDPEARTRAFEMLSGYEWRLGADLEQGTAPLVLFGLVFVPLTLESVELEGEEVREVQLIGRLQLPLKDVPAEQTDLANAVRLTFTRPTGGTTLTLSEIQAVSSEVEWPLARVGGESGDAPRIVWSQIALLPASTGLEVRDASIAFSLFEADWVIALAPLVFNGSTPQLVQRYRVTPAVAEPMLPSELALELNLQLGVHSLSLAVTVTLDQQVEQMPPAERPAALVWQLQATPPASPPEPPTVRHAFTADVRFALAGSTPGAVTWDKGALFNTLMLVKDSATGAPGTSLAFADRTLQFHWTSPERPASGWPQVLPGMRLRPGEVPGFATVAFEVLTKAGDVPTLRLQSAFVEGMLPCRWGQFLQGEMAASAGDRPRLFGSSAGDVAFGYIGQASGASWDESLLANGVVEIKNLISWPLATMFSNDALTVTLPAARGTAPLSHLRHTARLMLDQHQVPVDVLASGQGDVIFQIAGGKSWQLLAVVEHQLLEVVAEGAGVYRPRADRRVAAVQEVRLFAPSTFQAALGGIGDGRMPSPVDGTEVIGDASFGIWGKAVRDLLTTGTPTPIEALGEALVVEAGVPLFVRKDAASPVAPVNLQLLPGGTQVGALSKPGDFAPSDPTAPAWSLLNLPFLGRLQDESLDGTAEPPPADSPLLQVDPVLQLERRRSASGAQLPQLLLALASWGDAQAETFEIAAFDGPLGQQFARLDPLSLEESWFRLQLPAADGSDEQIASVLRSLPETPARLGRPIALARLLDPGRAAYPPQSAPVPQPIDETGPHPEWRPERLLVWQAIADRGPEQTPAYAWHLTAVQLRGVGALAAAPSAAPELLTHVGVTVLRPNPGPALIPTSLAVSPFVRIGFREAGTAPPNPLLPLVSVELLCLDERRTRLISAARHVWQDMPEAERSDLVIQWARTSHARLCPESPVAIVRERRLREPEATGVSDARVTIEYAFVSIPPGAARPHLPRRLFKLRSPVPALKFQDGHFGGGRMPKGVLQFEIAPPQVTGMQPLWLEERPHLPGAPLPNPEDPGRWSFGLSAMRLSLQYTDKKRGVAQPVGPIADEPSLPVTLWWQTPQVAIQYRSALSGLPAAGLPQHFRSRAIRALLPVLPDPPLAQINPQRDLSANGAEVTRWQPVLPGTTRLLRVGGRPGAFAVWRNAVVRQSLLILADGLQSEPVLVSGSVPVQHRHPRPVPLPVNRGDAKALALRTWASAFAPDQGLLVTRGPADEAYIAEGSGQPEARLALRLEAPVEGALTPDWSGTLTFQITPTVRPGGPMPSWRVDMQMVVGVCVFALQPDREVGEAGSYTFAPAVSGAGGDPKAALRQAVAQLSRGEPLFAEARVAPSAAAGAYIQTLTFPLLAVHHLGAPLPLEPLFAHFEDPEYNRRLTSTAKHASVGVREDSETSTSATLFTATLSADREQYNPDSTVVVRYDFDGSARGARLFFRRLDATGVRKPLLLRSTTAILVDPGAVQVFTLSELRESVAGGTQRAVFAPGQALEVTVQLSTSEETALVLPIVSDPVVPRPEAAYALLSRTTDGRTVQCARFAWGPAPRRIELVNAHDLKMDVVRRRAVFHLTDVVRKGSVGSYTLQKITPSGATHAWDPVRPPGEGIPRDPLSGYAVPLTQAEWDRVFAAAGVTPKTVNQSWGLQDLDGHPVATIGAALTASTGADALRYRQPVPGWERKAVVFPPDAGTAYLFQPHTIAVGPDPTVESALMFSYARAEIPADTRRMMVIAGGSTNAMLLGMTTTGHLRLVCVGRDTFGTAAADGVVRPLFLQYDRTNGVARAYSDQEIIAGTYSTEVHNSTRGFGTSNNTGRAARQSTLLAAQFRGANAEWTEAEMRAVMHVLLPVGRTVPW